MEWHLVGVLRRWTQNGMGRQGGGMDSNLLKYSRKMGSCDNHGRESVIATENPKLRASSVGLKRAVFAATQYVVPCRYFERDTEPKEKRRNPL